QAALEAVARKRVGKADDGIGRATDVADLRDSFGGNPARGWARNAFRLFGYGAAEARVFEPVDKGWKTLEGQAFEGEARDRSTLDGEELGCRLETFEGRDREPYGKGQTLGPEGGGPNRAAYRTEGSGCGRAALGSKGSSHSWAAFGT